MNKKEYAQSLFEGHLNCAQSVLSAYAPHFGIDVKTLQKIGSNFGGGMGEGEVCGAVSGAFIILGLKSGYDQDSAATEKDASLEVFEQYKTAFLKKFGTLKCKELIGFNVKSEEENQKAMEAGVFTNRCPLFIAGSIEILEYMINEPE